MAPAHIDARFLESIGRITVNFEVLSHIVELGVWILLLGNGLGEQRTGQIVTAERSFGRNVDLFSCLYRHRYPKQPHQALTTLCGKLQAIEDERNRIIHSRWTRVDVSGHAIRMKTTAKKRHRFSISEDELNRS